MNPSLVEVRGTLRADGTVVLDEKPALLPGRVRVTLETLSPLPAGDTLLQRLQAIRNAQKARGHVPRSKEEIDAQLRALDEEVEQGIREAIRLQEECRRLRRQAEQESGETDACRP
jgi:hypothetical protein